MSDKEGDQVKVEELGSCDRGANLKIDDYCIEKRSESDHWCFNQNLSHIVGRHTVHLVGIFTKENRTFILECEDGTHDCRHCGGNASEEHGSCETHLLRHITTVKVMEQDKHQQSHKYSLTNFDTTVHWISFESYSVSHYQSFELNYDIWSLVLFKIYFWQLKFLHILEYLRIDAFIVVLLHELDFFHLLV